MHHMCNVLEVFLHILTIDSFHHEWFFSPFFFYFHAHPRFLSLLFFAANVLNAYFLFSPSLSSYLVFCCQAVAESWFCEIGVAFSFRFFQQRDSLNNCVPETQKRKFNSVLLEKNLNDNYHMSEIERKNKNAVKDYIRENAYNRKSHFQFDITSKSDLSNYRAPSSKWLAKCDVHKLTLQINMGKKERYKGEGWVWGSKRIHSLLLQKPTRNISISEIHEPE